MRLLAALFFAATFSVAAQSPEVPHKMSFANMTLTIRDDARREIQKDVNALTQSPKHYNIKAERARTYFPIIEKIFAEEGVPDDFKYLVLQESSLIADAVSTSNAVGFWQFKDFTAIEMGLRVDKHIDERMNIASATRAAARYIKKNNTVFDNWLYALQAYQMGAGGVSRSLKEPHNGETRAEITSNTYWYIKKFLAHKIAFEHGCKGTGQIVVTPLEVKKENSLADIAKEFSVDEAELKNYNKWTKSGKIPDDRAYVVLIPGTSGVATDAYLALQSVTKRVTPEPSSPTVSAMMTKKINGVPAIAAIEGETPVKFVERTHVDLADFLRWNDISFSSKLQPGEYYFVGKKRARGSEDFHTVSVGENLWMISQKYGVRLKKLKKYNRTNDEKVKEGTVIYLSSKKPKSATNPVSSGEVVEVDNEDTFNWAPESEDTTTVVTIPAVTDTTSIVVKVETTQVEEELEPEVENDSAKSFEPVKSIALRSDSVADVVVEQPTTNVRPTKTEHVVQAKETLYAIAKIYNVGVMDLVNWNNLDLQQGIKIGQVLKVTDPQTDMGAETKSNASDLVHEVKSTDTLYSIARKYGVTIKEIMEWNDKKDFSVSIGEKLRVSSAQ